MSIGIPYELFWHLTPNKLPAFYKAYTLKRKIVDEQMWMMGQYVAHALNSTVCNNSFFRGKNAEPGKYPDKPFMHDIDDKKAEDKPLTEEEKRKQTEMLFMQLKIMGANHKNKANKSLTGER